MKILRFFTSGRCNQRYRFR